jgi:hypothetical protein
MYIGIGTVVLIVIIVLVVLMLRRRLYSAAAPTLSTCWPSRPCDDRGMPGQTDMHLVQPRLDDCVQHGGRVVALADDVMPAVVAPDAAIERRGEGGAARGAA